MTELGPSPTATPSRDHSQLTALLAQMGSVLLSTSTVQTTVELVTALATEAIPGAAGAGVTLVDDRGQRSMAASNALVQAADALQYEIGSGPCLTSWQQQVSVRIDDVAKETRWPQWAAKVLEVGVRGTLSVPLVAGGACLGAIKVYSTEPGALQDQAERLLTLFARQAAVLLANTQTLADARRSNAALTEALQNRDLVGQAKGILLAQGARDDAAAFATLVTAAQHTNTKLHRVARELVDAVISRNADRRRR